MSENRNGFRVVLIAAVLSTAVADTSMGFGEKVFATLVAAAILWGVAVFGHSVPAARIRRYVHGHKMLSLPLFLAAGALLGLIAWVAFSSTAYGTPSRPIISVSIQQQYEVSYLVVHNSGAPAPFDAQIEFASPPFDDFQTVFNAYWERGRGSHTTIGSDLQDRIQIGLSTPNPSGGQAVYLYYTNPQNGGIIKGTPAGSESLLTFAVKISSEPAMKAVKGGSLKGGTFVGKYRLTEDGLFPDQ